MVNGSTSISGIDTQMENSDTAICILRPNEISSPAHMMSWLLVKRESAFLTWQQKLRISSAQKIQHSNAVHSTHGIFFIWGNLSDLEMLLQKPVENENDGYISKDLLKGLLVRIQDQIQIFRQTIPYFVTDRSSEMPIRIIICEL